jgi:hypothetical protein
LVNWKSAQNGYAEIMAAVADARAAGIFVVSSSLEETTGLKFHGLDRDPLADPDTFKSYQRPTCSGYLFSKSRNLCFAERLKGNSHPIKRCSHDKNIKNRGTTARKITVFIIAVVTLCCNSKDILIIRDASGKVQLDGAGDTGVALDNSEQSEEVGRTMVGVYTCCAPIEGTACCAGMAQGLCFPYGGTARRCREEGGQFDGKDICSVCCPGLTKVHSEEVAMGETRCQMAATPSTFICVMCGDGICGEFENRCRCPEDCP